MKQATKHLLRHFGYEMRRLPPTLAVDQLDKSRDFVDYFDSTEGMTSFEEAVVLYDLARNARRGCIVEVGSYRGRSTVALGRGSLDGAKVPVFAIDPHEDFTGIYGGKFGPEDRGAFYQAMLDTDCYQVVRLINLSSEFVAPNWTKDISLLWIDGDHTYQAVKRDFDCWAPHLTSDAKVAFDDSVKPDDGPRQLIDDLLQTNSFKQVRLVGKVTILAKIGDSYL